MEKKRGRPKKEDKKNNFVGFRTDNETVRKLEEIADVWNVSRTKALEMCVLMTYITRISND